LREGLKNFGFVKIKYVSCLEKIHNFVGKEIKIENRYKNTLKVNRKLNPNLKVYKRRHSSNVNVVIL
jgi:hypothetical protein